MSIEAFHGLVRQDPVPLGEAALVAAEVLGHPAPVRAGLERLDELASGVAGRDLDAVCAHLFGELGFQGNRAEYFDAANSLLPIVLSERRGIPVTLAIVVVEVARRRGIPASVACMPGHVLVVDDAHAGRWVDAFAGGAVLDEAGARRRFTSIHGPSAPFTAAYLAATPERLVLARLLGNLVGIFSELGDARHLVRVHQLRYALPELCDEERATLALALGRVGRHVEAAELWELEAARADGLAAERAERRARAARANLN